MSKKIERIYYVPSTDSIWIISKDLICESKCHILSGFIGTGIFFKRIEEDFFREESNIINRMIKKKILIYLGKI